MAHVSKYRSVPFFVAVALVAIVAIPAASFATACTPQYVQLTEDPASKVLVGCCNADGTWKTGSLGQRACLNPSNMCQQGHCDGNPNSTCNGSYSNKTGDCVVPDGLFCKLGECHNQLCTPDDDPDLVPLRCDDHNDCKSDTCSGASYTTPGCSHDNVANATACEFADSDPCTTGQCTDGTCGSVPDPGEFCGTAAGNTCTPKHCDAIGACVADGDPITCEGTLSTCRKWACEWDGDQHECVQVKVDPNNPAENSCDTNAHDCTIFTCGPKGKCTGKPRGAGLQCDANYTEPLTDCISGLCDSRKNCELEDTGGVFGAYDGVPCGAQDSNVCTSQTCQGLTCGVVSCNTNACSACGVNGICGGTPPSNCTCTAP